MPVGKEKYFVVAVDYFTKWEETEPLGSITTITVGSFVWKSIVCRFEVLKVLVTDNGTQFDREQFQSFCARVGI